ncbi:MAG: flagellin, partial [Beijerinckiaceae bacterium]
MITTGSLYGYARSTQNSADLMRDLRSTMVDLQRQMATGKKAVSFAGLGIEARKSLDLNARLATLQGYQNTIRDSKLHIQVMDQSLSRIDKMVLDAKSMARPGSYQPDVSGRAIAQLNADENLKFAIDLLNADVGGKYLFSGRSTDVRPVVTFEAMIDGLTGRAGVRQMVSEREAADMGTGLLGRLTPPVLAGSTVSLGRDGGNPGAMFGFMISGISSDSASISTSGPAGA